MKDFLRRNGIWLLVIALLLSILIGVSSAFMGGNADPLSNLVTTITTPVRNGAAAVGDFAIVLLLAPQREVLVVDHPTDPGLAAFSKS